MVKNKDARQRGINLSNSKRYPKEIRDALRDRIKILKYEGNSNEVVAQILNSEGFKTPENKPLKLYHINNQLQSIRKHEESKRARAKVQPAPIKTIYSKPKQAVVEVYPEPTTKMNETFDPFIVKLLQNNTLNSNEIVLMIRGHYKIF